MTKSQKQLKQSIVSFSILGGTFVLSLLALKYITSTEVDKSSVLKIYYDCMLDDDQKLHLIKDLCL